MDDLIDDIEAGTPFSLPRQSNKKMKKRKQLDALLKFRSSKSNRLSDKTIRSSEDELFLPHQKHIQTKFSSRYRRWCSYTRHILSFCLVCIFMIVCVGLAYANIELKNEIQNLSLRVSDVEKRFSSIEINRLISTFEQIKNRLNRIERWNVSYLYDRLHKLQADFSQINKKSSSSSSNEMTMTDQEVDVSSKLVTMEQKSTQFSEVADELDKLSRDADDQATNMINEKLKPFDKNLIEQLLEQEQKENAHQDTNQLEKYILLLNESLYTNTIKWNDELQSLRSDFQNLNHTIKIQELTDLVKNSSDKTSAVMTILQSNLDKLRKQIESCNCTKEPVHLKPSIVDTNQLEQSIVTKPNIVDTSTTSKELSDKIDHNKTIDIAQILNQPSSIPN